MWKSMHMKCTLSWKDRNQMLSKCSLLTTCCFLFLSEILEPCNSLRTSKGWENLEQFHCVENGQNLSFDLLPPKWFSQNFKNVHRIFPLAQFSIKIAFTLSHFPPSFLSLEVFHYLTTFLSKLKGKNRGNLNDRKIRDGRRKILLGFFFENNI